MCLEVYADKWGIGIFNEGWHDSGEPGPIDLRLADEESLQKFIQDLKAMAVYKGWKAEDKKLWTLGWLAWQPSCWKDWRRKKWSNSHISLYLGPLAVHFLAGAGSKDARGYGAAGRLKSSKEDTQ